MKYLDRLVDAATMRLLDEATMEKRGVPAAVLMENAGRAAYFVILHRLGPLTGRRVVVLAGGGSNGGDGYVVARHLQVAGALVTVLAVGGEDGPLPPAAAAHRRSAQQTGVRVARLPDGLTGTALAQPAAADSGPTDGRMAGGRPDLLIDALLGTGLRGALRPPYPAAITAVNEMAAAGVPVVALDVPSGLDADRGVPLGDAVHATLTVTFGLAKTGLVQGPAIPFTGDLYGVEIGLDEAAAGAGAQGQIILPRAVAAGLREGLPHPARAQKGAFGRLLAIGGCRGMTGALVLTGRAALRTGAGLVTLALPAAERAV
ncbi:MAG: NAD(P)H-hydrate epimerase, partial [Thermaerobacterales bacterium]